jgi:hypothetical protein
MWGAGKAGFLSLLETGGQEQHPLMVESHHLISIARMERVGTRKGVMGSG